MCLWFGRGVGCRRLLVIHTGGVLIAPRVVLLQVQRTFYVIGILFVLGLQLFLVLVMRDAAILFPPLATLVGSVFNFVHVLIVPLLLSKHKIDWDRGLF